MTIVRTKGEQRKAAQGNAIASDRTRGSETALHLFLIVLLSFLVYSNTFNAPFIFDDGTFIVSNPAVRDLRYFMDNALAERAIGQGTLDANFRTRKVAYFTFALNHKISGAGVIGYHLTNLLIHVLNGMLVYVLVLLTFRTPFFQRTSGQPDTRHRVRVSALLAALMFISHPVQTQAVTYLSQRFASLATLFYLLTMVLYVQSRLAVVPAGPAVPGVGEQRFLQAPFIAPYATAVVSAVLAMLTKEIAFTLPLMVCLYEFLFFEKGRRSRILYLLPFLLTMLVIPLALLGHTAGQGELEKLTASVHGGGPENPVLTYLYTQFRVIVTYLRLLVLPVDQNIDYDYPRYASFLQPPVFLSFLFLLLLFGLAVTLFRRSVRPGNRDARPQRLAAFGLFWFFLALSVESSLLPLNDLIFEHRVYLPSFGIFLVVVAGLDLAWTRMTGERRKAVLVLLFAVIGIWSAAAYARNAVWTTKVAAWEDAVRKSPEKARPHTNLGMAYLDAGRYAEAVREQKRAISIDGKSAASYRNLSLISGMAKVFMNLGLEFMRQGKLEEAVSSFRQAAKIEPRSADIHFHLGTALEAQRDLPGAAAAYRQALELDPLHEKARERYVQTSAR